MLVSPKKMLADAHRGWYAIGAFNINNLELVQGIMEAAIMEKSPVILQTSEGAIDYAGIEFLSAIVRVAAKAKVPVAFHLDHGKNERLVRSMIKLGLHTSVMFDGSSLPFPQNSRATRAIVQLAHRRRIFVEAELGAIAGIEDFVSVSERDAHLTSPKQVAEFVKRTGCDALAVAIGTSHGAYKFKESSRLDLKRLREIKDATNVPLVLHGASGVPLWLKRRSINAGSHIEDASGVSDEHIKKAIKAGINKINVDTDLRIAFTTALREALATDTKNIDPRKYLAPARDLVTKVVREKMRLFGCAGKA
ncbi:MAG: class II fructose-bisphosphate aldolase [Patescibacteria group bacterium]